MVDNNFHLFWGGPFSQWARSKFTVRGIEYNCAEQFMMAGKAQFFNDQESLLAIMKEKEPAKQKAIGKKVKGFNKELWEHNAKLVVYRGNVAKFTQNREFLDFMKSTIGQVIVEASPYDKIWGIGLDGNDERCYDRTLWLGTNWLGEVLMEVRDDLFGDPTR